MLPLSKLPEKMPSAASMFSAYASVAASMMLMRSMANDIVPDAVKSYLESAFRHLFTPRSSNLTVVFDDHCGMCRNQIYEAAEVYLRTKISPTTERFKVGKTSRQKSLHVTIEKGEEVTDTFQSHLLTWKFVFLESNNHSNEKQYFELTFDKKIRDRVLQDYLPFVLNRAKEIVDGEKVVRLYTRDINSYDHDGDGQGCWGSLNLEHPSTFDTLAVDPELKKMIIDDLDRFLKRKEFYKKVGKPWKRGYLLYGPPGTGKSSLIAAMANYLQFDIYDLELSSLYCNSDLRRILVDTNNKSIIVIEDIDCCGGLLDRDLEAESSNSKVTLSGLLNFIDGLWSCCGDERIIIFTTNHKNRLDPALLRPGRMDMHICMSYLSFPAFRVLASNYLGINDHPTLFGEIQNLILNVNVTPAEVAEELMKHEDPDAALAGVVSFLKRKQLDANNSEKEASKAEIQASQEEPVEGIKE